MRLLPPARAAVLTAALLLPAAPAAAASPCVDLPASVSRASADPIAFQDAGKVTVSARTALRGVRVRIVRGTTVLATGRRSRMAAGRSSVPMRFTRVLGGRVRVEVSARAAGCAARRSVTREWLFGRAALPIIAGRPSAYVEDYGSSMKVVLRAVAGEPLRDVEAELAGPDGSVVARATAGALERVAVVELPLSGPLAPGDYALRLTGRSASRAGVLRRTQALSLRSAASAGATPDRPGQGARPDRPGQGGSAAGVAVQRATVDWSGGAWRGREVGGFVVPGLGYGEVVCRPNAQWVRFFSSQSGREIAMMNWTRRDWVDWREQALREAVLTPFTGGEFNEGFNKFGPTPEKRSTGTFEGIISDRGAFGSPGGAGADPTTLSLAWSWDFSDEGNARCTVDASFATETAGTAAPLARSLSLAWRGEANAAGRDGQTAIVEGLGRVDVTCAPGRDGTRWVTVTGPSAATVTRREGSEETVTPVETGPVAVPLPNNGMLKLEFEGGRSLLLSSRFKFDDPEPAENFCFVAGQAIVP